MMSQDQMSIREMQLEDAKLVVDYFHTADEHFLLGMGADPSKLPNRDEWINTIQSQVRLPYSQKDRYYIIWLWNDEPIGHSNVNHIHYGNSAKMHLHMWKKGNRQRGLGEAYLKLAIPKYFEHLKLRELWCEPYAHNPSPNKTLKKLGFQFVECVHTVPGSINLEQDVNRYRLRKEEL